MDLPVAFSELGLRAADIRALDGRFSVFEGTAWLALRRNLPRRIRIELGSDVTADAELDWTFPILTLATRGESSPPAHTNRRWRLWRPPATLLADRDRTWLWRRGFDLDVDSPVLLSSLIDGHWADPNPENIPTILELITSTTQRLAEYRHQAA